MKIDHNFAYAYFLLVLSIPGCHRQPDNESAAPSAKANASSHTAWTLPAPSSEHNLTIYGYNYTDLPISSFSVDGNGGGNLHVSTPTSSGGSSVCCYTFYGDAPSNQYYQPYPVKVRWLSSIGRLDDEYWCEQDVPLKGPIPANPNYLEVHFYQDGHIELAVTEQMSTPRLSLEMGGGDAGTRHPNYSDNINNAKKYATCERFLPPSEAVGRQITEVSNQVSLAAVAQQKAKDQTQHIVRTEKEYHDIEQNAYNVAHDKEEKRVRAMPQQEFEAYEKNAILQGKIRRKAEEESEHQEYLRFEAFKAEARKRNGQE